MYSEEKEMLSNTLKGVEDNIVTMANNGTNYDDITVVVIIDGIQKMHSTMVKFFEETSRQCETWIEDDQLADMEQLQADVRKIERYEQEEDLRLDLTPLIYDEKAIQWRRTSSFEKVYKEYMDNVNLL